MNAQNEKLPVVALIKVHGGKSIKPFFWFVLVDSGTCKSGQTYKARLVGESDNTLNIALLEPDKPVPKQAQNQSITKCQLRFLARGYPKTVKLFQESLTAPNTTTLAKLRAECFAAYCVEAPALTGELVKPAQNLVETLNIAKRVANVGQRVNCPMDLEIFDLIIHWRTYRALKPIDRVNALRRASGLKAYQRDGFGDYNEQALKDAKRIEKLCQRLGLPPKRKPGAPQKKRRR